MRGILAVLAILLSHQAFSSPTTTEYESKGICRKIMDPLLCESIEWRTKELTDQAKEGFGIMLDTFTEDVRPAMIKSYKWYYDNYGTYVGEYFWRSYDYISPSVISTYERTKEYWYNEYPEFFDELRYVPTPIKRAQEELLFAVWDSHSEDLKNGNRKLPDLYLAAIEMIAEAGDVRNGKVKADPEDQARLNRLLNDIRKYSLDPDMADCFRVYAVPSKIKNGFNTVCSIFLNKELYDSLDDDEVRAVIAHEMSHGINGDSIKTFLNLSKITLQHFAKLGIEELAWLLTDESQEYFDETVKVGTGEMIMHRAAEHAPILEMTADMNGAKILNNAGYSAEALISALYKLHGVPLDEKPKDHEDFESFRNYPSLYKREQAIRKVMRF